MVAADIQRDIYVWAVETETDLNFTCASCLASDINDNLRPQSQQGD